MEQGLMQMLTDGISVELILNLSLTVIVIYIMMLIKGWLENYSYWQKFKSSTIVSCGSKIQVATATGSKRGIVLPVTGPAKRIAVDFGDHVRYYTPKDFMTDSFDIVKHECNR